MPLYEFRCDDCGIFEAFRAIAEYNQPANCPTCQQPVKRIFSPPSAILSGSLRLKQENPEPQLIQRDYPSGTLRDREPKQSRLKEHRGGRPWMIGH
jgi:putative FmdB family regulatory protein